MSIETKSISVVELANKTIAILERENIYLSEIIKHYVRTGDFTKAYIECANLRLFGLQKHGIPPEVAERVVEEVRELWRS